MSASSRSCRKSCRKSCVPMSSDQHISIAASIPSADRRPLPPAACPIPAEAHSREHGQAHPDAQREGLPRADQVLPKQCDRRRADRTELEGRALAPELSLRRLPIACAHSRDFLRHLLRSLHGSFLERDVRAHDPPVVRQQQQQHRPQRIEKGQRIRRQVRPNHQPERIQEIRQRGRRSGLAAHNP